MKTEMGVVIYMHLQLAHENLAPVTRRFISEAEGKGSGYVRLGSGIWEEIHWAKTD